MGLALKVNFSKHPKLNSNLTGLKIKNLCIFVLELIYEAQLQKQIKRPLFVFCVI